MLEPGMELDADLGIDSIKRVEILSALQERLPEAPAVKPEHLGTLRTLGAIAEFLAGGPGVSTPGHPAHHANGKAADRGSHAGTSGAEARNGDGPRDEPRAVPAPAEDPTLQRLIPTPVSLDDTPSGESLVLRPGGEFWLFGDDPATLSALAARLESRGLRPVEVRADRLGSLQVPSRLEGLAIVAAPDGGDDAAVKDTFRVLRAAAPALRRAGQDGGAAFVTVARLDGAFGTSGLPSGVGPVAGALAGIAKTAAREWPEVACKAIDVDPSLKAPERAAEVIVDELFRRGPAEVGRSASGRITLELVPAPLETTGRRPPLRRGDVVVISGGARGVTAEAAVALAEAFQPTVVLLGRSAGPVAEPDWLAPLLVEADVKRAIATRANGHANPRAIAEEFERVSANREILRNLRRIEEAGGRALYRSVDVRDPAAVRAVLEEVRSQFGPIRGLVHGAGVLADRRIEDQTDEQFARVYDTKVSGLRALLGAIGPEELRALALFSSSTARFGRSGQVAYAAANEVLNKWARREAKARPVCRVVALNWGPWDGGMVTSSLKPLFEAEGVGLIPLREGARLLVDELQADGGDRPVEVVVLGPTPATRRPDPAEPKAPAAPQIQAAGLTPVFERTIDVASMPVLRAHVLDGRPVLPMALMVEWLAHGALHRNPGLSFCGLNDLRLLKGVIVRDDRPETVRVLAGKPVRRDASYLVPVELRGTLADGREIPHARGEVVLADRPPQGYQSLHALDLEPYPLDVAEVYRRYLFHGPDLRGLERIEGRGEAGITALCATAPPPSAWFDRPLRQAWLADPLAIDGAFQAMIVWTYEQLGAGSLPTCIGRYRQFRRTFPTGGVRIVARVAQANASRVVADVEFLDADGACVALMEEYECVVDASLNQAFRRNQRVQAAQG